MSDITTCPKCERKLRVPAELLGQKVKCPTCGVTFQAGAGGPASTGDGTRTATGSGPQLPTSGPASYTAEQPQTGGWGREQPVSEQGARGMQPHSGHWEEGRDFGPLRGGEESAAWGKVKNGLTLLLVAICTYIAISIVIMSCAGGLAAVEQAEAPPRGGMPPAGGQTQKISQLIVAVVTWIFLALSAVAHGMCAGAPVKSGAKGLGIAAFVLAICELSFTAIGQIASIFILGILNPLAVANQMELAGSLIAIGSLGLIAALLMVARWYVFLAYLRAIANYLQNQSLAMSVRNVTILLSATIGISIFLGGLAIVLLVSVFARLFQGGLMWGGGPGDNGLVGGLAVIGVLVMCIVVVLALVTFVWFIVVLVQARNMVAEYARGD